MKKEVDEATGTEDMVIIEHKEDLHPTIIVEDRKGEALAQYRALAARRPTLVAAHLGVAQAWLALGDVGAARTAWRRVLRLHPGERQALQGLAEAVSRTGRSRGAPLEWLREAAAAAAPAEPAERLWRRGDGS